MESKKIVTIAAILLTLGVFGLQAQNVLNIKLNTNAQTSSNLSEIRSIKFAAGNLLLNKTNSETQTIALNTIRYLSFGEMETSISIPNESTNEIYAYPNPATAEINFAIEGADNLRFNLTIVSLEGRIVFSQQFQSAGYLHPINISHLAAGIYFCRITSSELTSTVKFIKQ